MKTRSSSTAPSCRRLSSPDATACGALSPWLAYRPDNDNPLHRGPKLQRRSQGRHQRHHYHVRRQRRAGLFRGWRTGDERAAEPSRSRRIRCERRPLHSGREQPSHPQDHARDIQGRLRIRGHSSRALVRVIEHNRQDLLAWRGCWSRRRRCNMRLRSLAPQFCTREAAIFLTLLLTTCYLDSGLRLASPDSAHECRKPPLLKVRSGSTRVHRYSDSDCPTISLNFAIGLGGGAPPCDNPTARAYARFQYRGSI